MSLLISHNMAQIMDFIGQRADKFVVRDAVMRDGKIYKDVDHYTVTCPDCEGNGYYDNRGDVICEDCGAVLSGPPVVPTEHRADDEQDTGNKMETSRGLGEVSAKPIESPAHGKEEYNA